MNQTNVVTDSKSEGSHNHWRELNLIGVVVTDSKNMSNYNDN